MSDSDIWINKYVSYQMSDSHIWINNSVSYLTFESSLPNNIFASEFVAPTGTIPMGSLHFSCNQTETTCEEEQQTQVQYIILLNRPFNKHNVWHVALQYNQLPHISQTRVICSVKICRKTMIKLFKTVTAFYGVLSFNNNNQSFSCALCIGTVLRVKHWSICFVSIYWLCLMCH